ARAAAAPPRSPRRGRCGPPPPPGAGAHADATIEEVVADLGAALAERGRRLRSGKDGSGADSGADTEDLRIALQHYRDLTERLVRL
ncbi:hypothetical protein LCE32_01545, partial [Streptomyces sp. 7G]|nr:hypothetical protein [Streptomyces sp. 7G]